MTAIEQYHKAVRITLPYADFRYAVRNLPAIGGLKLIRAAFRENDGGFATLDHARDIYRAMTGRDAPGSTA